MAKNTKAPFDVTNLTPSRETYLVCTVLDAGKLGSNREILVRLFTHNNVTAMLSLYGKVGSVQAGTAQADWTVPASDREFDRYVQSKTSRRELPYTEIKRATVSEGVTVSTSKSASAVQQFVDEIYSLAGESISKVLLGSFMDIAPSHLESAKEQLSLIGQEIAKSKPDRKLIIDLSSAYFSKIPHQTGTGDLQIPRRIENAWDVAIHTPERVNAEYDFIQTIADSVATKSASMSGSTGTDRLKALGVEIDVSDAKTKKFVTELIEKSQGHHYDGRLRVGNVYDVCNPQTNQKFDSLSIKNINKLFHGSRPANTKGIIQRGLLIKPAGVSDNGSMFGNGIYLADKSSKSAQYAFDYKNRTFLFVCEVRLGRIAEMESANSSLRRAPDGFDSVQGVAGKTTRWSKYEYLAYNEFIVYDTRQVTVRHVAELYR